MAARPQTRRPLPFLHKGRFRRSGPPKYKNWTSTHCWTGARGVPDPLEGPACAQTRPLFLLASMPFTVESIPVEPCEGQLPGTSGLRKKTSTFTSGYYLHNFVQVRACVVAACSAPPPPFRAVGTRVAAGLLPILMRVPVHLRRAARGGAEGVDARRIRRWKVRSTRGPDRLPSRSAACCDSHGLGAFGPRRDAPGGAGTTSRKRSRSFCSSPPPTGSRGCGWGRMASCLPLACPRPFGATSVRRGALARGRAPAADFPTPQLARGRRRVRRDHPHGLPQPRWPGGRLWRQVRSPPARGRPRPPRLVCASRRRRRPGTTRRTAALRLPASPTPSTSAPKHARSTPRVPSCLYSPKRGLAAGDLAHPRRQRPPASGPGHGGHLHLRRPGRPLHSGGGRPHRRVHGDAARHI